MNNRQAGRRRGRGGQRSQGNPNSNSRIDNRQRGNANQLYEKYKNLARDAQMAGDRVNTEYYLQFADHYFRVLNENKSRFEEHRRQREDSEGDEDLDGEDEGDDRRHYAQRRDQEQRLNGHADEEDEREAPRGPDRNRGLRNGGGEPAPVEGARARSGEAATEAVWFEIRERSGATEFLGYDAEETEAVVAALLREGSEVPALKAGESGLAVLNQTPFYGESGGQVGDTGVITGPGLKVRVTATEKKLGDLFVHHVVVDEGSLSVDAAVELKVDHARRAAIRANHSATHLLHEALRQVLGDHVAQKGSLVAPERLRFDISHPKPIEAEELRKVEEIVNAVLLQNQPVITRLMAVDEAIESGARALFGEKYGDEVRVVSMGRPVDDEGVEVATGRLSDFSIELCGGTHVARTGDIGQITLLGESAVGAGVRRIEAMTGTAARRYRAEESRTLSQLAGLLKAPVADVPERLTALIEERRRLERELAETRKKLAMGGGAGGGDDGTREVNGVKLMARVVQGVEMRDLAAKAVGPTT